MNTHAITAAADDVCDAPGVKTLSIWLINPRFEPSYRGFEFALPRYPGDRRSTKITNWLSSVAGLCGNHDVTLLDENVGEIAGESMSQYDMIGVTGTSR